MMNLNKLLILVSSIAFLMTSCSGSDGEDGLDGFDGNNAAEAAIFEIEDVDFISTDGLTATINVTADERIDILQSDIALVYVLDPLESAINGADVWEPLPSTFFFDDGGYAQYKYNFIFDEASGVFDIQITLESNNFDRLEILFTDNQIFRIAVIPASNVNTFSSKASNLLQTIDDSEVIKLN